MIKLIFLLCLAATPAWAWQGQRAQAPYTGPSDIVAASECHALRACSNAIAHSGTAVMYRVRNTTSSELCDVLIAANGGPGLTTNCTSTGAGQTVSSFLGGTDGKLHTVYDQISQTGCSGGTTCNLVQTTSANQPTLSAADNYQVAINPGSTTIVMTSANNFAAAGQTSMTIAAVGNKTGQFNVNIYSAMGNQNLINGVSSAANTWQLIGTSGPTISATDGAWHTAAGLLRGAGSAGICLSTSCGSFTSTALVSGTAGKPQILGSGSASAVDKFREGWATTNHVLTASEASAINLNASTYWGFTPP